MKRAVSLAPSQWMDAFLTAYTQLMHPIVDATVGWIPQLFGLELLPPAKDAIVVYVVMGATVSRGVSAVHRRHGNWLNWANIKASIWDAVLWPKTLALLLLRVAAFSLLRSPEIKPSLADYEDDDEGMRAFSYQMQKGIYLFEKDLLKDVRTEVLFTLAIVLCAIVANEAGLLD